MQTDDTLLLDTLKFLAIEDQKIKEVEICCKRKETLMLGGMLGFNGNKLLIAANHSITFQQKGQGEKITIVDLKLYNFAQKYLKQYTHSMYLALIC